MRMRLVREKAEDMRTRDVLTFSVVSDRVREAVENYKRVVLDCRATGCACGNCLHIDVAKLNISNAILFELGEEPHYERVVFEEDPKTPQAPRVKQSRSPRYVYLMKNTRNGLVKIGISSNPKYREATLQSEEPEIEMLFSAPGSESIEGCLHRKFQRKRVRGEWFKLDESELQIAVEIVHRGGE